MPTPPKHAGGDALSDEVRVPREVLEKAVEALVALIADNQPYSGIACQPDSLPCRWCDGAAALSALREALNA